MDFFNDLINSFNSLLENAILLFGLGFLFAATSFDPKFNKKIRHILLGLTIGGILLLIMRNPWVIEEGLIFDTRTVLLSVTGMFFGGLTTGVAVFIALVYRISLGGSGIYSGVTTILASALIGLNWQYIKKLLPKLPYYIEYYILGLIVHIATLLAFLLIPWPQAFDVIRNTYLPYLILFPILTMLLAVVVHHQKTRINVQNDLNNQKILLQASIDSTHTMEIFAVDTNFNYLSFNNFHKTSIKKYYGIDVTLESNFLNSITHESIKGRLQESIERSFKGESFKITVEVEDNPGSYLEEVFSPIYNEGMIIGATVFIQDITLRKQYENEILALSYKDALTGLNNRRKHQDQLARLKNVKYNPISVVYFDINGLKVMNDAFGHVEGDRLIILVAKLIKETFNDFETYISRLGGDEIIVLLPNTGEDAAKKLADKAKTRIENEYINHMAVSVSYGVSTKLDNEDLEDVINVAETDLYKNKLFESSSHRNESIKTILNTLKTKDVYSETHSNRVADICKQIGRKLGMTKQDLNLLTMISNLHDIGKISIDDKILNKPGKLTEEEWKIMKRHPETGYRILSSLPEYGEIAEDILSHHERYDGYGYPRGLKGEDIPIRARIISIADAYDAMTSDRPYRSKMTHEVAMKELLDNKGTQFDPKLIDIFVSIFSKKQ
ncbi:MAG: HD domain-containing phosphohydrolase [Acholeplasmataceae bacterium]